MHIYIYISVLKIDKYTLVCMCIYKHMYICSRCIHIYVLVYMDLYLLFSRFGNVISVHIMVNKLTGLSRGFGFISYDTAAAASLAIEEMNGVRVSIICWC